MSEPLAELTDSLRGRVLRGLRAGILARGDRLATSRDVAAEFGVDYRVAIAAYKTLHQEGLVELRPRGGVYVAAEMHAVHDTTALAAGWLVDVLSDALQREIPPTELADRIHQSFGTVRLRAVVIASNDDQCHGLSRELREDFGLDADGITARNLRQDGNPSMVARAHVLVTTTANAEAVRDLGRERRIPVIVIDVRPELRSGEWTMLLRQPVWVIVATPAFAEMLAGFFRDVRGSENLTVLVSGRDDVSAIPEGAPTYVTQRVRAEIDLATIKGRILPAARTIAAESARELLEFMVRANLRAMQAMRSE